eukprot:TRINITY_DN6915_c0_g1_i5.p1 TRINITY_DN6915_c0_g1~~TRINITY_DN6915_c0_g1_i5.p1  ORF type:complete len:404 (-),score=110.08 TRINITY_DN6915_c0_g1_i5:489-1700(-)
MSEGEWQCVSRKINRPRRQQQERRRRSMKKNSQPKIKANEQPLRGGEDELSPPPYRPVIDDSLRTGLDLIGNRNFDEVIQELRRLKCERLMVVVEKSAQLLELGNTGTALDLLDQALAVDEKFAPALMTKLRILSDLERYEDCLKLVPALAQVGEAHHEAKFAALMHLGKEDEAIEFISSTKEAQSKEALCYLCGLLCFKGRVAEAVEIFDANKCFAGEDMAVWLEWILDELEDRCVSSSMASAFKVKVLMQIGRYDAALQVLGPLLEVFPSLVCTESKEDIAIVESVLSRYFSHPVETPVAYQLLYYAHIVGRVRSEVPVELGELIAIYAREWSVFDLKSGDLADVKDFKGIWYESEILLSSEDSLYVHYNGWSSKWDEWVPRDSERIAAVHTFTFGPRIVF